MSHWKFWFSLDSNPKIPGLNIVEGNKTDELLGKWVFGEEHVTCQSENWRVARPNTALQHLQGTGGVAWDSWCPTTDVFVFFLDKLNISWASKLNPTVATIAFVLDTTTYIIVAWRQDQHTLENVIFLSKVYRTIAIYQENMM